MTGNPVLAILNHRIRDKDVFAMDQDENNAKRSLLDQDIKSVPVSSRRRFVLLTAMTAIGVAAPSKAFARDPKRWAADSDGGKNRDGRRQVAGDSD